MNNSEKIDYILKKLYFNPKSIIDYVLPEDYNEFSVETEENAYYFNYNYTAMKHYDDLMCSNKFAEFICEHIYDYNFMKRLSFNELRIFAWFMHDGLEINEYYIKDYEDKTLEEVLDKVTQQYQSKIKLSDEDKKDFDRTYKLKKVSYYVWQQRYKKYTAEQIEKIKNLDVSLFRNALSSINNKISTKYEIEQKPLDDRDFLFKRLRNKEIAIEEISQLKTEWISSNPLIDLPRNDVRFLVISNEFLNIINDLIKTNEFLKDKKNGETAINKIIEIVYKGIEIKTYDKKYSEKFIPDFNNLKSEYNLNKAKSVLGKCQNMNKKMKSNRFYLVK